MRKTFLPFMERPGVIFSCAISILFLTWGVVFAGNFTSPPTLYTSFKDSACAPTAYTAPLDPRNLASFRVQYLAAGVVADLYPWDPTTNSFRKYFYGDDTVTESQDFSVSGTGTVDLSATPGIFDAKSSIHAWRGGGGDAFVGALASVGRYFTVNGPTSNEPIQLVADILFQGKVFAKIPGGDTGTSAAFTNILAVVAAPTDPTPMPQFGFYMNGAASNRPWTGNTCETVNNFLFPADGLAHDINVIIRSRPFTVKTGVPYRMNLNINASAGAYGEDGDESYVDFMDPKLVTSMDFATVKDQNNTSVALSASGFFLKNNDVLTPLGPGSPSKYTVTLLRLPVGIDIMPKLPNFISLWPSWGIVPVAILSSKDFNALDMVDQRSLTFGATGDEHSFSFCDRLRWDINHDQYRDLVCYFQKQRTEFECGDTKGILKGKTVNGLPIEGKDSVKIILCK